MYESIFHLKTCKAFYIGNGFQIFYCSPLFRKHSLWSVHEWNSIALPILRINTISSERPCIDPKLVSIPPIILYHNWVYFHSIYICMNTQSDNRKDSQHFLGYTDTRLWWGWSVWWSRIKRAWVWDIQKHFPSPCLACSAHLWTLPWSLCSSPSDYKSPWSMQDTNIQDKNSSFFIGHIAKVKWLSQVSTTDHNLNKQCKWDVTALPPGESWTLYSTSEITSHCIPILAKGQCHISRDKHKATTDQLQITIFT